jgi:hypothetical protein
VSHIGDALYVLNAVFLAEAQSFAEVLSDDIAVQNLNFVARRFQPFSEGVGDSRFPCT